MKWSLIEFDKRHLNICKWQRCNCQWFLLYFQNRWRFRIFCFRNPLWLKKRHGLLILNLNTYLYVFRLITLTSTTNAVSFCTSAWRCTSSLFALIFSVTCAILKKIENITFSFKLRNNYDTVADLLYCHLLYMDHLWIWWRWKSPHLKKRIAMKWMGA